MQCSVIRYVTRRSSVRETSWKSGSVLCTIHCGLQPKNNLQHAWSVHLTRKSKRVHPTRASSVFRDTSLCVTLGLLRRETINSWAWVFIFLILDFGTWFNNTKKKKIKNSPSLNFLSGGFLDITRPVLMEKNSLAFEELKFKLLNMRFHAQERN